MAQIVMKACDFDVKKGRKTEKCGQQVPDNEPTYLTEGTTRYSMDLCAEHQQLMREVLLPFTSIAFDTQRRMGTQVRKAIQTKSGKAFTTKDVRTWLQEQGRDVPESGRLPKDLIEEYANAHGG